MTDLFLEGGKFGWLESDNSIIILNGFIGARKASFKVANTAFFLV